LSPNISRVSYLPLKTKRIWLKGSKTSSERFSQEVDLEMAVEDNNGTFWEASGKENKHLKVSLKDKQITS
jgi:hypothetical protein